VSELAAYNIQVQFQDAVTFFGVDPLPAPTVGDEILTRVNADDMDADSNYKLIRYMDLAMDPVPTEESAVDDFVVQLVHSVGLRATETDGTYTSRYPVTDLRRTTPCKNGRVYR